MLRNDHQTLTFLIVYSNAVFQMWNKSVLEKDCGIIARFQILFSSFHRNPFKVPVGGPVVEQRPSDVENDGMIGVEKANSGGANVHWGVEGGSVRGNTRGGVPAGGCLVTSLVARVITLIGVVATLSCHCAVATRGEAKTGRGE